MKLITIIKILKEKKEKNAITNPKAEEYHDGITDEDFEDFLENDDLFEGVDVYLYRHQLNRQRNRRECKIRLT